MKQRNKELRQESGDLQKIDDTAVVGKGMSRIAVDVPYQVLRRTASIKVTKRTEAVYQNVIPEPGEEPIGKREIVTLQSVPYPEKVGNDVLVTIPSGHGEGSMAVLNYSGHRATFEGGEGRNHSSVANEGVANRVIPWLQQTEREYGDFK